LRIKDQRKIKGVESIYKAINPTTCFSSPHPAMKLTIGEIFFIYPELL